MWQRDRVKQIMYLAPTLELVETPVFSVKEEELKQWGCTKDPQSGKCLLPNGRQNKSIARNVLNILHQNSHRGTQAMIDLFLKDYGFPGIYMLAKQQ